MKRTQFTGDRTARRTVLRGLVSGVNVAAILPRTGGATRTALQEEPGDEKSEALPIESGEAVHASIGFPDRSDWFTFDVTGGDAIRVDFHESPPAFARLIGPDDAVLDRDGPLPNRLTGSVSRSGAGYLHVTDPPGGANSTYSFTLSLSSADDDGLDDGSEDDTDDGTDDSDRADPIRLSNERVTVTFDRADRDSRVYLSSFSVKETEREVLGDRSARFRSVAPDDAVLSHDRTHYALPRSEENWNGYVLDREFSFDERRVVRIMQTVKLFANDPFVIIETTLENTGTERVLMNQPASNIHRGWRPAAFLKLAEPVTPSQFHVSGSGTFAFDAVGRWRTFPLRGTAPFVTLFDDEQGMTYIQLDGATAPELAITERTNENYLSYAVRGLGLTPGEDAQYTTALGGHSGGERAIGESQRLVSAALSRV